jgi:hypothetical protein
MTGIKCWNGECLYGAETCNLLRRVKVTNRGGRSCITFQVSRSQNVWNLDSTLLDRFIVLSLRAASLYMQV